MYGVDTMGISDSALQVARSRVATAAAPQAGGKNPDLTLHTLDGGNGTLDPAFPAHVGLVKQWALAWWEGWFCREGLVVAFEAAFASAPTWGDMKQTRDLMGSWLVQSRLFLW